MESIFIGARIIFYYYKYYVNICNIVQINMVIKNKNKQYCLCYPIEQLKLF